MSQDGFQNITLYQMETLIRLVETSGAAVPVEDCVIERRFYLIYRKQFRLMKHHRRFLAGINNFQI